MNTREPCGGFEYRVGPNDTYALVARRFALGVRALQTHNSGAAMMPGRTIRIPCEHGCCRAGRFYVIRKGDTLLGIVRHCGLTLSALLAANPYLNPAYYVAGQVVVIPKNQQDHAAPRYTLGPGDGLIQVLRKFRMDVTTFCALNPGLCPMDVRPGMTINVSRGGGDGVKMP